MSAQPKPPDGFETWLDWAVRSGTVAAAYARDELQALRERAALADDLLEEAETALAHALNRDHFFRPACSGCERGLNIYTKIDALRDAINDTPQ